MTSSPGKPAPSGRSEASELPRVVILGRPNVGKSTLFNALLHRRRAITHSRAGVTRDPVEVDCALGGKRVTLVDTGGFAADADGVDAQVSVRSLRAAEQADLILMILDALETTAADDDFLERLRPYSPKVVLVVNKVDTPERDPMVWNAHAYGFSHVLGVSAAHGRGLGELADLAAQLLEAGGEDRRGAKGGALRSPQGGALRSPQGGALRSPQGGALRSPQGGA
ncbi:MAG TPA: GTPase, partial [Spirochaetia bacterium]|nr:GTPase [Spirochaetia bacterium]